jgi:AcrR family transcriptional regulator
MPRTVRKAGKRRDSTLWQEVQFLKRDRILNEAALLFAQLGYHSTTIGHIADRFGATKPFVYYHFKSKLALLIEICERGTIEALSAADKAISAPGTPSSRLNQFVRDFTAVVLENHLYVKIYFREQMNLPKANSDRINRMRKEIDSKLTDLLEAGVTCGEFTIEDLGMSCLVIAGMSSYAFAWYRREGRLTNSQICRLMSDLVLDMVKGRKDGLLTGHELTAPTPLPRGM